MTASSALEALLDEAALLPWSEERLLAASQLAEAINEAVLNDAAQLEAVRSAIRDTATAAGCDLIVGASPAADEVVRALNAPTTAPTRVLLFDLVRITGAAFAQASSELRHVDVVPAVLLDLTASSQDTLPYSVVVREAARC